MEGQIQLWCWGSLALSAPGLSTQTQAATAAPAAAVEAASTAAAGLVAPVWIWAVGTVWAAETCWRQGRGRRWSANSQRRERCGLHRRPVRS